MLMPAKRLEYVPDPNKFDLRTHVWDAQGKIVGENLYRSFIIEGRQVFERPVGSGNLWHENNQPAGRVEYKTNDKGHIYDKKFHFDAPHTQYSKPLSGAEKVHFELEREREENARLKAELEALKSGKKDKPEPDNSRILAAVHEGFPAVETKAVETDRPQTEAKSQRGRPKKKGS